MEPITEPTDQLSPAQLEAIAAAEAAAAEQAKTEKKIIRAYTASAVVGGAAILAGSVLGIVRGFSWAFYLLLIFVMAPAAGSIAGVIAFNV